MLKEEAVKLYELKEAEFPNPEMLRELERVFPVSYTHLSAGCSSRSS